MEAPPPWISTTLRSWRSTAPGSGPGSRSTRPRRRSGARPRSSRTEAVIAARRAWQAQAHRGRPQRRHLAEGVRRPGPRPAQPGRRQPGDRARRRPGHPRRDRRRHARPDDHRPRHGGAEGAATCCPCCAATRSGASCSPSRPPVPTSRRSRPARAATDDGWVLSGQKVWTTNAQFASYGLLLARTDADLPKHKGLTMFIVPMDAPGVTVRPLRQISGDAHFNEVFLDDVPLDGDAHGRAGGRRLGRRTDDADVRARDDRPRRRGLRLARRPLRRRAARRTPDARRDPEVRHRFGELATEFLALRFTGYRMLTTLQRGGIPGPEGGLAKVTTIRRRSRRASCSPTRSAPTRCAWTTPAGASWSPTCPA